MENKGMHPIMATILNIFLLKLRCHGNPYLCFLSI